MDIKKKLNVRLSRLENTSGMRAAIEACGIAGYLGRPVPSWCLKYLAELLAAMDEGLVEIKAPTDKKLEKDKIKVEVFEYLMAQAYQHQQSGSKNRFCWKKARHNAAEKFGLSIPTIGNYQREIARTIIRNTFSLHVLSEQPPNKKN